MLNLYSVYSASNVRRLCALLCPAISFLHFHVLQIGPSISRPSFSRPAFSAPPTGRIRYTHLDVLATHLVLVLVLRLRRFKSDRDEFRVNIYASIDGESDF